jgi:hypothetical protein
LAIGMHPLDRLQFGGRENANARRAALIAALLRARLNPEHALHDFGRILQRKDVHAGSHAQFLERADQFFGRKVAARTGCIGAPSQTADGAIDDRNIFLKTSQNIFERTAKGIVEVECDLFSRDRSRDVPNHRSCLFRPADADRVAERNLVTAHG